MTSPLHLAAFALLVGLLAAGCSSQQSPECTEYVACQKAINAQTGQAGLDDVLAIKEADGECWDDPVLALACTEDCKNGLVAVQGVSPLPVECGGTGADGACNEIANVGVTINATVIDAAFPTIPTVAPAIPPGTYVLVRVDRYRPGEVAGPSTDTYRTTLSADAAGLIQIVQERDGEKRATAQYVVNGDGTFDMAITCPVGGGAFPADGIELDGTGAPLFYSDEFDEVSVWALQ